MKYQLRLELYAQTDPNTSWPQSIGVGYWVGPEFEYENLSASGRVELLRKISIPIDLLLGLDLPVIKS